MKYKNIRVNENLIAHVVIGNEIHNIERIRIVDNPAVPDCESVLYAEVSSPLFPLGAIITDMELQLNPDNPSYRDIPAFCDVCDEWLDDCECPDIEKSVYG